jgi:hypothetical protein
MRLIAVLICLGVMTADASAQSLGEAAERERQRLEKIRQGGAVPKVITDEGLKANPGKLANDPSIPPAVAAQPVRSGSRTVGATSGPVRVVEGGSTSSNSGPGALGSSEASVRAAFRAARQNIARLEAEVNALDGKATGLAYGKSGGGGSGGPPDKFRDQTGRPINQETPGQRMARQGDNANALLEWRKERADVLDRLERSRAALVKAQAHLATLEESARRQGIPPGWLRE